MASFILIGIFLMRILTLGLLAFPWSSLALACAACGFGQDSTRSAFLITTALLTCAPIAMIGGVFLYLKKKAK